MSALMSGMDIQPDEASREIFVGIGPTHLHVPNPLRPDRLNGSGTEKPSRMTLLILYKTYINIYQLNMNKILCFFYVPFKTRVSSQFLENQVKSPYFDQRPTGTPLDVGTLVLRCPKDSWTVINSQLCPRDFIIAGLKQFETRNHVTYLVGQVGQKWPSKTAWFHTDLLQGAVDVTIG